MSSENIAVFIGLFVYTIVNIIAPLSGSTSITPLLVAFTDPHKAIGVATFYFLLTAIIRVLIFWRDIHWTEVKRLFLFSICAAVISVSSLIMISPVILLCIVFIFSLTFLLQRLHLLPKRKVTFSAGVTGAVSGFLQGSGLAGSELRNNYLLSRGLALTELHGTTAIIGGATFLLTTIARLCTNQISFADILPILYLFPVILVATLLGKKLLKTLSKQTTNFITISILSISVLLLGYKIFALV